MKHIELWLAALYLALLAVPVAIGGRMYLHDALVPLMGIAVLLRGNLLRKLSGRLAPLAAFLALGILTLPLRSLADCYEWAVFAYMAVLFMFFSEISLPPRRCLQVSLALFALCLAAFIHDMTPAPPHFSFVSPQMQSTAMPFLARRFAFTQGNPNLFALFLAIPCALLARWIHSRPWESVPLHKRLLLPPACLIVMLPVLSSASKHGLLPLALLAGCFPTVFPRAQRLWKALAMAAVPLLAAMFETTVICTVFPITDKGINTASGMYSLHQSTYVRMLKDNPGILPLGADQAEIHSLYPQYANQHDIADTLERYNAMASYKDFITFMDPHNEFLNLSTMFGLPAMLAMLCFWTRLPRSMTRHWRFTASLFVLALLACCLWDDLLSKRAVWLAAAILFHNQENNTTHESSIP